MKKNKVEKLYCALAIDNEGIEGICAHVSELGSMPLVISKAFNLDKIKMAAQHIANESGTNVIITEFSVRRDIVTFTPQRKGKH